MSELKIKVATEKLPLSIGYKDKEYKLSATKGGGLILTGDKSKDIDTKKKEQDSSNN